jgi:hypothetical protein
MSSMNVLAALALTCSLARAAAPPLDAGTTEPVSAVDTATLTQNAKTLLNAEDRRTALAVAEAAVAAGGGAGAFAARAEAKLALGRPLEEALSDYAEAARLDARYGEKYRDLLSRVASRPGKPGDKIKRGAGGASILFVVVMTAAGLALLAFAILILRA